MDTVEGRASSWPSVTSIPRDECVKWLGTFGLLVQTIGGSLWFNTVPNCNLQAVYPRRFTHIADSGDGDTLAACTILPSAAPSGRQ